MSSVSLKKRFNVHFIGIGGVSMSALAKYLIIDGFIVTGSDKVYTSEIQLLRDMGAKVIIGHKAENVKNANIVVYNSAITGQNVELKYALKNKIPIISRAQLLKMIARRFKFRIGIAGSHGKTTVTSIIAHIFMCSNLSFTAHIGGNDKILGNLAMFGKHMFVSEVCEFNKNIRLFEPDLALCLNVDNDHLNCYSDISLLKDTMFEYLDKASSKIINIDDQYLKSYKNSSITFGITQGDYTIKNERKLESGLINFDVFEYGKHLLSLTLNPKIYYTHHNVLASICVARELKIAKQHIINGFDSFSGVERRNEYLGSFSDKPIYIDYAHHPTELKVALNICGDNLARTLVIFQPHTYSRTRLLFEDFINVLSACNNLIIYKTYAAREDFDYEGSAERLSKAIKQANYYNNEEDLVNHIIKYKDNFDKILVLGAGDLYITFKNLTKKKTVE